MTERLKYPLFSHNLRLSERESIAKWIRAVRSYNHPEDNHYLRGVGVNWFTALGHCYMDDRAGRRAISARLQVIERQRDRNEKKLKKDCTSS